MVQYSNTIMVQLFSTNAFSANTFSLNILTYVTAIYSQSIVNTNNFLTYFYQRKPISGDWHRIYSGQTNSSRVIRLEVLGQDVLVQVRWYWIAAPNIFKYIEY